MTLATNPDICASSRTSFSFNKTHPSGLHYSRIKPLENDLNLKTSLSGADTMQESGRDGQTQRLPWIARGERPSPKIQDQNRNFFDHQPYLLMLVGPVIEGFSLEFNKWFLLDLSKLQEIQWTPNPLCELILDAGIKKTLTSFSKHYLMVKNPTPGPFAAKGTSLVVLLCGPSGTGKTLTAEVFAEEARLPLYRIMPGQLGWEPSKIEEELAEVMELAIDWKCVVLFEEANTFIRQRKTSDRVTSEFVSIFLRHLEYFQGIIFLTTNMPDDIDDALRSHCRLHIAYRNLDAASGRPIWKSNFAKAGIRDAHSPSSDLGLDPVTRSIRGHVVEVHLTETELEDLMTWKLNSHEIQKVV